MTGGPPCLVCGQPLELDARADVWRCPGHEARAGAAFAYSTTLEYRELPVSAGDRRLVP